MRENPIDRIKKVFRTAFRSSVSDPRGRDHEAVKREIARSVVMRVTTASVRLQRGQYSTRGEIDQCLERVKGYNFGE